MDVNYFGDGEGVDFDDISLIVTPEKSIEPILTRDSKRLADKFYARGKAFTDFGNIPVGQIWLEKALEAYDVRDMHFNGADAETLYRSVSAERMLIDNSLFTGSEFETSCNRAIRTYRELENRVWNPECNAAVYARIASLYECLGNDVESTRAMNKAKGWASLAVPLFAGYDKHQDADIISLNNSEAPQTGPEPVKLAIVRPLLNV